MQPNGSATSSKPATSRQATLTSAASLTCAEADLNGYTQAISSPVSADGPSPSGLPGGPITDLFGQEVAPASRSPLGAKSVALTTNAIFGPSGFGSSASEALQSSLANRLRAKLDTNGSPEFILSWSRRRIRSGLPICVLRASRRNTPATNVLCGARRRRGTGATFLTQGRPTRQQGEAPAEHSDTGLRARVCFEPNPGTLVRIDGLPRPVGQVRAFGNAIVPQVAAAFIEAAIC
jgi:hypothetical protein